jgi:hypothetical protein
VGEAQPRLRQNPAGEVEAVNGRVPSDAPYSEFPYLALVIVALATVTACATVHRHPSTGAGEGTFSES